MAAFTSPAGKLNSGPLAASLNWVKESTCVVVEFRLLSDLMVAAEVRLLPMGFHTSSALAAVSGSCVAMSVVPTMEGVTVEPPVWVVPFKASRAQLLQKPL